MKTIRATAHKLWSTSPADLYFIGRRKIRQFLEDGDLGWDYSLEAVLRNRKHIDFKMEIERWVRLWRMARLHGAANLQEHFDFNGKAVLECGCGPVFGTGPVAFFRGAMTFWYQEPSLQRKVTESTEIKNGYFLPLYQELIANYGRRMSFAGWYTQVMENSFPLQSAAKDVADITISHSVLEHIPRRTFAQFLRDLYLAARPGAWFVHVVDFGPHGHADGTLPSLYKMNWEREPAHLNLLRQSDVESAMKGVGFDIVVSLIYKSEGIDRSCVHASWRKYSEEDLSNRVAFLLGKRPS
jgi:hypothetical protein